jgi:AraC-like DNA-binding protein
MITHEMNVLACLPPDALARLRAAVADVHRVHVALHWAHASSIIQRFPVDVVVVDLTCHDDPSQSLASLHELRNAYPSLPVVLHSALEQETLASIAAAGHSGVESLVVAGVDDDPISFRATLERQPGVQLAAALEAALAPQLHKLPEDVARAVQRVLHTPAAFKGVPDLAAAANISRRTIYRECERAGLASPREIIAAARVLRAYAFLRECDHSIEDVADALRFSSPHHLTKTMRWACGLTTARARDRISPADFVALLAARLVPPVATTSSSSAS